MKKNKPNYAALGRLGGLVKSEAKAAAAITNGKRSPGAPKGSRNAAGERKVFRCVICSWSGKRRDAGKRCPACHSVIN